MNNKVIYIALDVDRSAFVRGSLYFPIKGLAEAHVLWHDDLLPPVNARAPDLTWRTPTQVSARLRSFRNAYQIVVWGPRYPFPVKQTGD